MSPKLWAFKHAPRRIIRNGTEASLLLTGLRHRSVATRALVCPAHWSIGPCLALRHRSLPTANGYGSRSRTKSPHTEVDTLTELELIAGVLPEAGRPGRRE